MDSSELAAFCVSVDYEPRRMESTPRKPFFRDYRLYEVIERVKGWETEYLGYTETVYNEALAKAAFAWSKGHDFAYVRSLTDADEGSIVLAFRRAIDLLRQMAKAMSGHAQLVITIREAIKLIDRDIVEIFV